VKKIKNGFYGLESSLYLFSTFVGFRNHFFLFFHSTYNSLFTSKPRIPIEMSIGLGWICRYTWGAVTSLNLAQNRASMLGVYLA